MISSKDREKLRRLASHQYELSQEERNIKLIQNWYKHNDFQDAIPPIHIELDTFEHEVIPKRLQCEGEFARQIETSLYRKFINYEVIKDDWVVPDYYHVWCDTRFIPFGMQKKVEYAKGESGGHHFISQITDLSEDFDKLKKSEYWIDMENSNQKYDFFSELFQDILPVKMGFEAPSICLTQNIIHLMSMENMFIAMYDEPELFGKMIGNLADDYIEYLELLEKKKVYISTNGCQEVCQGTLCFTKGLPDSPRSIKEMWGHMDSQETSGISPNMYEELVFPAYQKVFQQFGMGSYGCCEAVDPIWDSCISKLQNLRKVSISPWCNEEKMGERLCGRKVVYQRKPSPNYIGIDATLDETAYKKHIKNTVLASQGCQLEITMRDIYTIHNDEGKAKRSIEIARECIEKYKK